MIPFDTKSFLRLPANCLWEQILEHHSSNSKFFEDKFWAIEIINLYASHGASFGGIE